MWLAGDTKGLLLVIPFNNWMVQSSVGWYANLLVSTTLFVFASYHLSEVTSTLTHWICKGLLMGKTCGIKNRNTPQRNTAAEYEHQSVPLLPTPATASTSRDPGNQGDVQQGGNNYDVNDDSVYTCTSFELMTSMNGDNGEASIPIAKPSLGYRIISDPRLKVLAFLVGVGSLNRLI